jgi:hypothetical protein
MGRRDIASLLLERGAALDLFARRCSAALHRPGGARPGHLARVPVARDPARRPRRAGGPAAGLPF